jgi:hypothetical protein
MPDSSSSISSLSSSGSNVVPLKSCQQLAGVEDVELDGDEPERSNYRLLVREFHRCLAQSPVEREPMSTAGRGRLNRTRSGRAAYFLWRAIVAESCSYVAD